MPLSPRHAVRSANIVYKYATHIANESNAKINDDVLNSISLINNDNIANMAVIISNNIISTP